MARARGSVRMGPVSLFALVIVICLAVLAVLTLVTARASEHRAERQAESVQALYANESAGQALLASLDAWLADKRDAGATQVYALGALEGALPDLAAQAAADASTSAEDASLAPAVDEVSVDADDAVVSVRFVTPSGRALDIELRIADDLSFVVEAWRATTLWTEDTSDTVWAGPGESAEQPSTGAAPEQE